MHVARKVEILEISERLQKKKRRKRMLTVCNNMDGSKGYYAKWNKSDKDKYHTVSLICRVESINFINEISLYLLDFNQRNRWLILSNKTFSI